MIELLILIIVLGIGGSRLGVRWGARSREENAALADRSSALALIARLARTHGINAEEFAEAVRTLPSPSAAPEQHRRSGTEIAKTLFTYLGAIFIVAGLGSYIGSFWSSMGSAMRIVLTLGVGYLLLIVLVSALHEKKYPRLEAPLILGTAAMLTGGWFVLIHELFPGGHDWRPPVAVVFGLMAVHQALLLYRNRLTMLVLTTLAFAYGFAQVGLDLLGVPGYLIAIGLGASLFCLAQALTETRFGTLAEAAFLIAAAWFNAGIFDLVGQHHDLRLASVVTGLSVACAGYGLQRDGHFPRLAELGYAIGSVMFYIGLFEFLRGGSLELLFLAATAAALYACVQVQSRALLLATVLAMLGFIGYFGARHFANSLGWPVTLVLIGAAFLGVGMLAMRMRRQM